jgi:uncharacterized membrane protein YccC
MYDLGMTLREAQRNGFLAVRRLGRRLSGLRYAVRVLLSGVTVWFLLGKLAHVDPLWGLISAVVVTDLKVESAMNNFVSRMMNTLIGCGTGLLFLKLFGAAPWVVLLAMPLTVIVSADLVRVPISWRIAPITAAIVMTPATLSHSAHAGLAAAMERTGDVLIGSVVAVAVSYATAVLLRRRRAGGEPSGPTQRPERLP